MPMPIWLAIYTYTYEENWFVMISVESCKWFETFVQVDVLRKYCSINTRSWSSKGHLLTSVKVSGKVWLVYGICLNILGFITNDIWIPIELKLYP